MDNEYLSRPVIEADVVTRKVVGRYPSYIEAGEATGMSRSGASHQCRTHGIPYRGRTYLRFEDDFDAAEELTSANGLPVYVTDGTRLRYFYSVTEACDVTGISRSSIQKYAKSGSGRGLSWGRIPNGLDALLAELRKETANG